MRNRYFGMRHGQSQANVEGILVSNPEEGVRSYGLTPQGRKQVENAIRKNQILDSTCIIYSSEFLRAKESAEIVKDFFCIRKVNFHKNLRERRFGSFDKKSLSNLQEIWKHDEQNANHSYKGVEPPTMVLARVLLLVDLLEKRYSGRKILLVSHGDVLQILHVHLLGMSANLHRKITHLETAEIRELSSR